MATTVAAQTAALDREVAMQQMALAANKDLDTAALLTKRQVRRDDALGYDPRSAKRLDLIQASSLALGDRELAVLQASGFAISRRHEFPSFGYGYAALYAEDLPLYVSLDSVMEAVHRSYDSILSWVEDKALVPELRQLLAGMRANLRARPPAGMSEQNQRDAELYLTVAQTLLDPAAEPAGLGVDPAQVSRLVGKIAAAQGAEPITLFGTARNEDFSQFKPRGHYTDTETLGRYFRAMMWLGRVDFRMLESDDQGKLLFRRRQVEAAVGLGLLLDDALMGRWKGIDDAIGMFVGESDSMRVTDVPKLLDALGAKDLAGIAMLSDDKIAQTIIDGGFGAQRIASSIMIAPMRDKPLPLARSFLLFGQRYVLDSHVFSNLVFDRLQVEGAPPRMLPDPLDIAYAALGNDDALPLLKSELDKYDYAPQLEDMRMLADAHGDAYWNENLYGLWMSALRGISAAPARAADPKAMLPTVMRSEAWGRRLLSTQLASWAELRHDTILYVKQSYTGGIACEFPDGYVDPYPQAWAALERFARMGKALSSGLLTTAAPDLAPRASSYFATLEKTVRMLREMASTEIEGKPFTAEQLAFIKSTVAKDNVCGSKAVTGWYGDLYIDPQRSGAYDPVIADVHTQPTDEVGKPVGKVVHVGVGMPRLMVVTANTCNGPRAYAGLVASYFEHVTENYQRITDEEWSKLVEQHEPTDVDWMTPVLGPAFGASP